jgi:gliding motility-associated-like protein
MMKQALVILFFLSGSVVHAQTCTGGLGDPIVNITFGAGPNFGPPLSSGITTLQYISDQCPSDGYYTIANSTTNCFEGTWLNINADHTGDPNGYFMLINASYQPSDFYVQTVSGLCAGTTYQFAAWVLNLSSQPGLILPNITFSIEKTDGTLLDSIHTGNVPQANPGKWNQYGFYFTTPVGVSSVVLRMTNNAPGGDGNDLALDDITFRPAGPLVTLANNGLPGDTTTICIGGSSSTVFSATVENCYSNASYQWQLSTNNGGTWGDIPGATGQTYSALPLIAGTYMYRLTTAEYGNIAISSCKVASSPATILVLGIPNPAVAVTASSVSICAGSKATFTAVPADGGNTPSYQWLVDGQQEGTDSSVYSTNTLSNGDIVTCLMTSDASCLIDPFALSNAVAISVTPEPVSSVNITASALTICSDSVVDFNATPLNGGSHPSYAWMVNDQPVGADTSFYSSGTLNNGDLIQVVMTGNLYCSVPDTSNGFTVTVYPKPAISLTPDTIIAPGESIRLSPLIIGQIATYQWTPITGLDNPGSPDPVASPVGNTTYQLEVTTLEGCYSSAKETVAVFYDLLMPNAFTPNGDGRNDLFRIPPSVPVTVFRFSVYNRWGEMVFTGTGGAGWDGRVGGKPQPAGVYVWIVEYYDPLTKNHVLKKGTVELIR